MKANLEQGFWNIINGEKNSSSKRLSVDYAVTDEQVATVPDVERALLVMAISWCGVWLGRLRTPRRSFGRACAYNNPVIELVLGYSVRVALKDEPPILILRPSLGKSEYIYTA